METFPIKETNNIVTFPFEFTKEIETWKTLKIESSIHGTDEMETFHFESTNIIETIPFESTYKIETFPYEFTTMMKTFPLKSTNMIESLKTIKMETETYGTNPKETFPFESSFKVETYSIDSTNKIETFPEANNLSLWSYQTITLPFYSLYWQNNNTDISGDRNRLIELQLNYFYLSGISE